MLTVDSYLDDVCEELGIEDAPPRPIPPPIDWIEHNFYLYDTGKLMNLYPCQKRPLELALSRNEQGKYNYNTVLWSWPKKSAKSSIIAAVADYVAEHHNNGSVKLVANDLKQADSRVGYYLREAIKIGQRNGKRQGINVTPSGYKVTYPNGSKLECVPIDPSGEAGGNDDMIVYSELWGWKSKAHQRMWSEMTLSPTKWGNSQRWIDTYAGITGESPILEQLYETGVKQGTPIVGYEDLEVYENKAAKMLTVWVTKPMLPWQTKEYYDQERGQLLPSEFDRMHGNQWSSSQNAFVPEQWWDACRVDSIPDVGQRGVIIGLDAARANDCFAVVIVTTTNGKVQVLHCKTWKPENGQQIQFNEVEIELLRLFKVYNVVEVAYDPSDMTSMSQRLSDNVFWREFKQGQPRIIADKLLYDVIRDRRIEHTGDTVLREHVLNADAKPDDEKVRIVKRNESLKIDACVALAMATDRALYYNL